MDCASLAKAFIFEVFDCLMLLPRLDIPFKIAFVQPKFIQTLIRKIIKVLQLVWHRIWRRIVYYNDALSRLCSKPIWLISWAATSSFCRKNGWQCVSAGTQKQIGTRQNAVVINSKSMSGGKKFAFSDSGLCIRLNKFRQGKESIAWITCGCAWIARRQIICSSSSPSSFWPKFED